MAENNKKNDALVLSYIRAIAALIVTYGHILTYFPKTSEPVFGKISETFTLIPRDMQLFLVGRDMSIFGWKVSLGEIGLSLFFLLSGFLILRSRSIHSTKEYIVIRICRIFPVAIISVVVCSLLVMLVNYCFFSSPFEFSSQYFAKIFANAFLFQDLTLLPISIPVYWSLYIEIKFYLMMLLVKEYSKKYITLLGAILFLYVWFLPDYLKLFEAMPYAVQIVKVFASAFVYIIYMLIGCYLYLVFKVYMFEDQAMSIYSFIKKIKYFDVVGVVYLIILFLIASTRYHAVTFRGLPVFHMNYLFSLSVFCFLLIMHKKITLHLKFLKFLSKISYPLYTLHFSVGGVAIFLLSRVLENVIYVYFFTFVVLLLVSFIMSKYIEFPGIRLGKKIITRE